MIELYFKIKNPFKPIQWADKHYVVFEPRVSKNYRFCFQISRFVPYNLIEFNFNTTLTGTDHAGPLFDLNVFGFMLYLNLYRIHHWNHDENRWYRDGEDPFKGSAG